jgi:hypothetical protein
LAGWFVLGMPVCQLPYNALAICFVLCACWFVGCMLAKREKSISVVLHWPMMCSSRIGYLCLALVAVLPQSAL